MLRVTSYAPDRRSCRPYSGRITACGESVRTNDGHLVAADTRLIPFHYMVRVPGYDYGRPVPVLDHGGAIRGYRLDVLLPTFRAAQDWGVKLLRVRIYRPLTGAVSLRGAGIR
jgi:3D (Asp-Asp-Asp) domain-containing protein